MSVSRAASRYAKSLLDLARERKSLDKIMEDMLLFSQVCENNRGFVMMLRNPIVTHDKKRTILNLLFQGKVDELTLAFFDIVTKKRRESILPDTAEAFRLQYNIEAGIQSAQLTTASEIDESLRSEFEKAVKQISGKKPELKAVTDEKLIGGYILRINDRRIDESLSGKLKALKLAYSRNPYIKEF